MVVGKGILLVVAATAHSKLFRSGLRTYYAPAPEQQALQEQRRFECM